MREIPNGSFFKWLRFSANPSVLCIVIGEAVRKLWFLLTDSLVIVAVDACFTIISYESSLGCLVGH